MEYHLAIKSNMCESQRQTESSQSLDVTSSMILCMWQCGKGKSIGNGEEIGVCQRLVWGKGVTAKGQRKGILWLMELPCVLIVEVVTRMC